MSIRVTSGRSRETTSTASSPLAASPTTSKSGSSASSERNPARTMPWSSTITSRMLMSPPPAAGSPRAGPRRSARAPGRRCRRTAPPARGSRPGRARRSGLATQAAPVVLHLDVEPVRARSAPARRAATGMGVPQRVGEALLRDPVRREVDARDSAATGSPSTRRRTCMSPEPDLAHQPVELAEAGLRGQATRTRPRCAARRRAGASPPAPRGPSPRPRRGRPPRRRGRGRAGGVRPGSGWSPR